MSVAIELIQYEEIIAKLNELLGKVSDAQTQQQIRALLEEIRGLVAKESKQDNMISQISAISSKIDQILSMLGAPKPTYSVTVTASSVGANKHHLVVFNGNPNIRLAIRRIILSAEVTATVTGFQMSYRIQRISAVSGGTTVAVQKFDTSDPDLTGITVVANPTSATVVGTLDSITINPEETGGQHTVERIYGNPPEKPIILYQNQGISIQQYGTAGVGTLTATIIFTVE